MERFLIINIPNIIKNKKECWILVSDYSWYNSNYSDIKVWAKQCLDDFKTEGMVIKFKTAEDRNFFLMRWASV